MNSFIPVCEPTLSGNEKKYVNQALDANWIGSNGEFLDRFHKEFPQYLGVRYGTTTTNGTTALHLALVALGIGPGDEVILPDFTMIAPAFAIRYVGATPVFVDADPETWNIDTKKIEEKITAKTKAIMPVHIYGLSCDMDPILEIAKKHGLKVLEDAAEAIGSTYRGKKCGSMSHISAFSFYSNKNITCGEGGFVATDDPEFFEKCQYHKNLCFQLKGPRNYLHNDIGFNYRMTNIQAAILTAQLEQADKLVGARIRNGQLYKKNLARVRGLRLPLTDLGADSVNTYWMFGILIDDEFGLSRDEVMKRLREQGIDSRAFFMPMHVQPALSDIVKPDQKFPVSMELSRRGIYLPSSSSLTDAQIDRVCETLMALRRSAEYAGSI